MKKMISTILASMLMFSSQLWAQETKTEQMSFTSTRGTTFVAMAPFAVAAFVSAATACVGETISSTQIDGAQSVCSVLKEDFISSSAEDKKQRAVAIQWNSKEVVAYNSEELVTPILSMYQLGLSLEKQKDLSSAEAAQYSFNQSSEQIHQTLGFAVNYIIQK